MKGAVFHQKHEFVKCKCGRGFEREVRKTGGRRKLCDICKANLAYKRKKRRNHERR